MKYSDYLAQNGLTNKEVVELLSPHFPKLSKATLAMVNHPENYGIQLTPKAWSYLPPLPRPQKKISRKKKAQRIVLYLDREQVQEIDRLMQTQGFSSKQDYLQVLLLQQLSC